MQTNLEKLSQQKILVFTLIATTVIILLANFLGEETSVLVGNLLYFPIVGYLVLSSLVMSARSGITGEHGIAWILFSIFAILWFVAESLWSVYELVLEIDPFPSEADAFYLSGYVAFFVFTIFYLRPVKKSISKPIVLTSILISLAVLLPSIYIGFEGESDLELFDIFIAASYPIADGIVLAPAIIGVILFFTGKVNFLWTLICIGMISIAAADTLFLFTEMENSYYVGHPIELLWLWGYLLFAHGVVDHIQIFQRSQD